MNDFGIRSHVTAVIIIFFKILLKSVKGFTGWQGPNMESFPLTSTVAVTTDQQYRTACDRRAIEVNSCHRTQAISRERLELETLNLACRLITRGTIEKHAKLGQRGSGRGQVPTFKILGPLPYLENGWS